MIQGLVERRRASLRAVLEHPSNEAVIIALADILVQRDAAEEALRFLSESPEPMMLDASKLARLGRCTG